MKRIFRTGTVSVLALSAAMASAQVQVTVDGNPVSFRGQGPIMRGDRVLVPLRGVLEQMGATVNWNPDSDTVTARTAGSRVRLRIGDRTASVNGQAVDLDVPAQIINGSTMVPLRFVGEALGNTVRWDAQSETVEIMSGGNGGDYGLTRSQNYSRPERFGGNGAPAIFLSSGTVVPVRLDQHLSSDENTRGDRFTASPAQDGGLPSGTKIEGYVEGARPRDGDQPGMLELKFDRIDLPNGDTYPIKASLIGLDDKSVTRRDGRLVAKQTSIDRGVFTGIGAGAGLIVGLIGHRPLEDTALGALLGFGIGSIQQRQVHNVSLDQGTKFGVRFNSDVSINGG